MIKQQEHAFKTFSRDIKNDAVGNLVVLYGEEDYLIEWAAESIIKKYINASMLEMDLVKFGDDDSIQDIVEACDTFSMFSEKRVVWAKNLPVLKNAKVKGYTEDDKDLLIRYASAPNSGTVLILSSSEIDTRSALIKGLKENAQFYDFSHLDETTLYGFAEKRFNLQNVEISRDNLRLLISESGYLNKDSDYRLHNLVNDINKIAAHSDGGKVAAEDITRTLNGDLETFVFDFLDAVSTNKKETAFRMLHNIISGGNDVFSVLGLLINHFELVLEVAEFKSSGISRNEMIDKLKLHEFRVKKAAAIADRFDIYKLKSILTGFYEVDRKVKTGEMDAVLALELIVAGI